MAAAIEPARQAADDFGAFVAVRPDQSFVQESPLHGSWLAVKDNICVAGLPHTAGHPMFAQRVAPADAEAVSRLRAAGARVLGVTHTDAGGFGVTTPGVLNPANPALIVGGSSGGSAAAVAAGLADIGLGTDTGGSVRIPAACCGLYAFKPSAGRVPLDGVWPMAPSLDHLGLISRGLPLLRTAAPALLGTSLTPSGRMARYGVDPRRLKGMDPVVANAFAKFVDRLRAAGACVLEVELPQRNTVRAAHAIKVLHEARGVYAPFWPQGREALGAAARHALGIAQDIDAAAVVEAEALAARIRRKLDDVLAQVDAVLTPTLPVGPPAVGTRRVSLDFEQVPLVAALTAETAIANLTGCPALVLPMALGPGDAGSTSVQVLAAHGEDGALFEWGLDLELMAQAAPHMPRRRSTRVSYSTAADFGSAPAEWDRTQRPVA